MSYVINLDRSPERYSEISTLLDNQDIPHERVCAIDGKLQTFTKEEIDEIGYERNHGKKPTTGETACYLSHIKSIKKFIQSPYEYALILEDDMTFGDGFKDLIERTIKIHDHWDVVRLFAFHWGLPVRQRNLGNGYKMSYNFFRSTSAGAYLINRKAAVNYVEKLLPIIVPYDHEFTKSWKYNIRIFSLYPSPCRNTDAPSTIDYSQVTKNRNPWFKKCQTIVCRAINVTRTIWHGIAKGYIIPKS